MHRALTKTIALVAIALVALALCATATRVDAAFSRRKPITIDFNQVSGPSNLANFPVLVSLVDTDLELAPSGDVTSAEGYDILFRAEDDTTCGGAGTAPCVLDHEIESYDGSTGTLVVFVRVPVLQNSVNTVIYMYYGDVTVTCSQENSEGVWDSKSTTTRIAGGLMKAPRRGRSAPEYNRRNVAGSTPDLSLPTVRNPPEPFLAASSPIPSVKS